MKTDLAFHLTIYGFCVLSKKQQKFKSVKPNIFFSFLGWDVATLLFYTILNVAPTVNVID